MTNEQQNTYIALKMIEGVYKQGLLTKTAYRNMLDDYKNVIDITEFLCYINNTADNKTTIKRKEKGVA